MLARQPWRPPDPVASCRGYPGVMPLPALVEPVAALSESERARTARHAVLAGFGDIGQRRLAAGRVAVIGVGGLGSPVVLALAAAGVGELIVIDDDDVELTNLQRQVLHRVQDVGSPKIDSARRAAADLGSATVVRGIRARIDGTNADDLLADAHLVIDGSDTFATRAAVAAACERRGIPLAWGTVQEFAGQATVFWSAPPEGVLPVVLSDLYPPETVGEVPSCAQVGVLGALCVQVGGALAIEAVKLLTGIGEPLLGRILLIDALSARVREVPLRPSGQSTAPAAEPLAGVNEIDAAEFDARRGAGVAVLDVREPEETALGTVPGALLVPLATVLDDPAALGAGPYAVVCKAGMRAHRAARALAAAGADVVVLAGGMDAWARGRA